MQRALIELIVFFCEVYGTLKIILLKIINLINATFKAVFAELFRSENNQ